MLSLRKPSAESLRRILAVQAGLEFTYDGVGATAAGGPMPAGYVVDHTRAELGYGAAVFERARAALARWEQFRLGWMEAFPADTPLRAGETVVVIARVLGLWWTNAARIVYAIDEAAGTDAAGHLARFGFAYGTLPGHVESGEERFLIEWDRHSDQVWFDIQAFSRPRHFLSRVGHRHARKLQKQFGIQSASAMQRAVEGTGNCGQGTGQDGRPSG